MSRSDPRPKRPLQLGCRQMDIADSLDGRLLTIAELAEDTGMTAYRVGVIIECLRVRGLVRPHYDAWMLTRQGCAALGRARCIGRVPGAPVRSDIRDRYKRVEEDRMTAWRNGYRERLSWARHLRFRDCAGRRYVVVGWDHRDRAHGERLRAMIEAALFAIGWWRETSGSSSEIASVSTFRVYPH